MILQNKNTLESIHLMAWIQGCFYFAAAHEKPPIAASRELWKETHRQAGLSTRGENGCVYSSTTVLIKKESNK